MTRFWTSTPVDGIRHFIYRLAFGSVAALDSGIRSVIFQVFAPTRLTFGETIPDQTYRIGLAVELELPVPTDGVTPLTYTLTRRYGSPVVVPGLTFNANETTPTLTGTPTAVVRSRLSALHRHRRQRYLSGMSPSRCRSTPLHADV